MCNIFPGMSWFVRSWLVWQSRDVVKSKSTVGKLCQHSVSSGDCPSPELGLSGSWEVLGRPQKKNL